MSDANRKWSDVGVNVTPPYGYPMFGWGDVMTSDPWKPDPGSDTVVPIIIHVRDGEICDEIDKVNLQLPAEMAAELGEWLVEHAHDEPNVLLDGDGDE